jgi:PAS domain S-box-containing protein
MGQQIETYEKILNNVNEEIMLLDTNLRILWANARVMREHGSEIVSKYCYKVTHGIDHPCEAPHDICPVEEVLKTGRSGVSLHRHFDEKGNSFYADVTAYPVHEKGTIREIIHISKDVTERVVTEERLKEQQKALLELSSPIVRVWDKIIMVPLIGIFDSNRAQVVTETLLEAIEGTQAIVAILDISGIPVMDTMVANHLLRTIAAAKLMGTVCIVTGVRSSIAQTVVQLGVDLSGVVTKSTMLDGLRMAFELTGQKVVTQ